MSRRKAKLESLQRSQRYKYYFTPDFFIHINMIDYMATAIHIQRQKFLKIKTETNGCIPHFLIMPDRVKLLTIPCKYTLTKAVFVSKAHAW